MFISTILSLFLSLTLSLFLYLSLSHSYSFSLFLSHSFSFLSLFLSLTLSFCISSPSLFSTLPAPRRGESDKNKIFSNKIKIIFYFFSTSFPLLFLFSISSQSYPHSGGSLSPPLLLISFFYSLPQSSIFLYFLL